jgi:tRNA-dihydrouridine synthase
MYKTIHIFFYSLKLPQKKKVKHVKRNSKWWTSEEHTKFLELVPNHCKQYSVHFANRSVEQIRSHVQKYFLGIKQDPEYKMYSNIRGEYHFIFCICTIMKKKSI